MATRPCRGGHLKCFRRLALLGTVAALAGACDRQKAPSRPVPIDQQAFDSSLHVNLSNSTRTSSGLYVRDVQLGRGPQAKRGDTVEVFYTGWLPDGTKFDAANPGQPPYTFTLGAHQVIDGWDDGIVGMQAGGVRQLIIPPELGYGAAGRGPIPANTIMVFIVELESIR